MIDVLSGLARVKSSIGCPVVLAGSISLRGFLRDVVGIQTMPAWVEGLVEVPLLPIRDTSGVLLRRILIGTGLVADPEDRTWLADNVDLALPYPALRFLDQLAMTIRETGHPLGAAEMDRELESFLRNSDVFREVEMHIGKPSEGLTRETVETVVDEIAGAEEPGIDARRIQDRTGPEGLAWLLQTLPLEQTEGRIRSASRLFTRASLRYETYDLARGRGASAGLEQTGALLPRSK